MAGHYYDRPGKRISAELAGCLFQKPGYRDIATCIEGDSTRVSTIRRGDDASKGEASVPLIFEALIIGSSTDHPAPHTETVTWRQTIQQTPIPTSKRQPSTASVAPQHRRLPNTTEPNMQGYRYAYSLSCCNPTYLVLATCIAVGPFRVRQGSEPAVEAP